MALQLVSKESDRKITKPAIFCDFFAAIFIRAIIATRSGLHAIYELEQRNIHSHSSLLSNFSENQTDRSFSRK